MDKMKNKELKPYESSTEDIIKSLHFLAKDIETKDGIVNAALEEAANRMVEMLVLIDGAYDIIGIYLKNNNQWKKNWMEKAKKILNEKARKCGAVPSP